nr:MULTISPECIES: hypothetical protein [unclassified Sphingomonas]
MQPSPRSRRARRTLSGIARHPLPFIIALALALRIASAAMPVIAHPDEIYQYLEPAHRLLTGEGIVTWEWRLGMRSWLLPTLLAPALALGGWIAPGAALLLPRLLVAIVSLTIPLAAWAIGLRTSTLHAFLAALVGATWFECVYFAGRTLSEPLAAAAILPAAVLVTAKAPRTPSLVAAGALLGFAVLLRPHYAPACIVLVGMAMGRRLFDRSPPLVAGALIAFMVGATVDLANGAPPFAWVIANFHANIVEHRADAYGIAPPLTYVAWFEQMWSWWGIPMLIALRWGWRHSPPLLAMALVNLAIHMVIGHKEYRFVFLSGTVFVILAALGTADLVRLAQRRVPGPLLPAVAIAAWMLASLALFSDATMLRFRESGRAGTLLFAEAAERDACGVALYEHPSFVEVPGSVALPPNSAVHLFTRRDRTVARIGLPLALARGHRSYNMILAGITQAHAMPAGYSRIRCVTDATEPMCLFVRAGECVNTPRSPTLANHVLARLSI